MNLIKRVELLGYKGKLHFTQNAQGLTVDLPDQKISELTCALRITGQNLKPAPVALAASVISPDSMGR